VFQDIMAPETENGKTLDTHEFVTPAVVRTVSVLAAIDFDNEFLFSTAEIGEVGANRQLPGKLVSAEFAALEFKPKQSFGLVISLS
jgi:hypothetical protein